MQLSSTLTFEQMLTKWSGTLNPVIANLLIQGIPLNQIFLPSGNPQTISHHLGRNQIGFIITDINADVRVWRTQPLNSQTLTLQSSANVTINLWNF